MTPEPVEGSSVWAVRLSDGQRREFRSNAAAWAWIDRQERYPLWARGDTRWRVPLTYASSL